MGVCSVEIRKDEQKTRAAAQKSGSGTANNHAAGSGVGAVTGDGRESGVELSVRLGGTIRPGEDPRRVRLSIAGGIIRQLIRQSRDQVAYHEQEIAEHARKQSQHQQQIEQINRNIDSLHLLLEELSRQTSDS